MSNTGLYLGERNGHINFVKTDTHSVIIGSTRSGKSRCIILPSIALISSGEENIVATDPKGELYLYTKEHLLKHGYEVIALDFKEMKKSTRYNFLQGVIDAVNDNDISKAVSRTRDIVSMLMNRGSGKGEPIWENGERSVLTCGILAVVYENRKNPEFQNLTNVYHFLGNMCKSNSKSELPLVTYLNGLDDNHPAKASIHISDVAPEKTRGSFYTSALARLEIFSDISMYNMTNTTDFDIYNMDRKRAIFIILPDYKKTYHEVAALFIYQYYQLLAEHADKNGNRLKRRVHFLLDEAGNFPEIPDFNTTITVSGGRGILFHLALQDFNQLDETYGDKKGKTIRSNCETWIYLQTDNDETLKELSSKLGTYTIKNPSYSSNGSNTNVSLSYTHRELLKPEEIKKIRRPYALVTSRDSPCIITAPDISKTAFNSMFGLGDEKHNISLQIERNCDRKARENSDVKLWGIWKTRLNYNPVELLRNMEGI